MDRDDIDFELRDIDEDILDLLENGRQTRQNLAALLDVTGEYVYQRIDLLIKLGIVEKIHDGFYELDQSSPERSVQTDSDREDVELPADLEDALDSYRSDLEDDDPERADQRVAAARAVMELLVSEGGIGRQMAQERLLPEFAVDEQSEKTWWERAAKDILGEHDSVRYNSVKNEYVYTG